MRVIQNIISGSAAIALIALLSACGGQSFSKEETMSSTSKVTKTTTNTTTSNPTPTATPCSGCGGLPPVEFNFSVSGSRGVSPPADSVYTSPTLPSTDTLLKVRIKAGNAATFTVPGYTAFVANYHCIQYKISVGNQDHVTQLLKVPGSATPYYNDQCPGAPESEVIDFSGNFGGGGSLQVKVSSVMTDFYCNLYYAGMLWGTYGQFCQTILMYQNHRATGTLKVQTDGHSAP